MKVKLITFIIPLLNYLLLDYENKWSIDRIRTCKRNYLSFLKVHHSVTILNIILYYILLIFLFNLSSLIIDIIPNIANILNK